MPKMTNKKIAKKHVRAKTVTPLRAPSRSKLSVKSKVKAKVSPMAKVALAVAPHVGREAVIVAYTRSPFTPATKGALATVRPDDMAAQVVKGLLKKAKVRPTDVEDLILGCAFPEGEQGFNLARLVVLRFCGSSMQAVHMAAANIAMGMGDVFIAAGVESMSRVPLGVITLCLTQLYTQQCLVRIWAWGKQRKILQIFIKLGGQSKNNLP
jgi:Thiolase, N-terminal domain